MNRAFATPLLVGSALLLAGAGEGASQKELSLDGSKSTIGFHARNTFDEFDGVVSQPSGSLMLENDRPSHGTVKFPVLALTTHVDGRDTNMRSPKYLDIGRFPTISFDLDSFDGPPVAEARNAGSIKGALHITDHELPVVARVTYARSGSVLTVEGDFPLDIRQLGMDPPTVALVQRMNPTIRISFKLVFQPADAK
jgi:polyisoprenoid-binding protein YceI